jgi:hypothetical protein
VIEPGKPLNDESYLKWFGWALLTLGRDLEPAHASAEAAARTEAAGQPLPEIQAAARRAGDRPQLASPMQIALTEWAFWAQTRFGKDQSASLQAARQALAELESTHDLETTTKRMRATLGGDPASTAAVPAATRESAEPAFLRSEAASVTSSPAATGGVAQTIPAGEPLPTRSGQFPIAGWLGVVAVVIVGVAVFLWVFAISPRVFPPTLNTSVSGGYVYVTVDNYPANEDVHFFVDKVADQVVSTDGSGHASAFLVVAAGQHLIAACRDSSGYDCPAIAQVFK